MWGSGRDDEPDEQQARPCLAKPGDERRARGQSDDADEDGEADGVEDPEGRFGDSAERRIHRAQPAEDQAHDERASARGERERQPSDVERQQPDETADDNAQAEEHDVRLTGGTLDVAQRLSGALHVPLRRRRAGAGRPG